MQHAVAGDFMPRGGHPRDNLRLFLRHPPENKERRQAIVLREQPSSLSVFAATRLGYESHSSRRTLPAYALT